MSKCKLVEINILLAVILIRTYITVIYFI